MGEKFLFSCGKSSNVNISLVTSSILYQNSNDSVRRKGGEGRGEGGLNCGIKWSLVWQKFFFLISEFFDDS